MKNKKGFTLVELVAVIVILILLMVIAINMANKHMESTRINAFIKEANTFARGAMAKEAVDKELDLYSEDIFHNSVYGKVCYSINQGALDKYVTKTSNTYKGSVEVCYGLDCTYLTKVWITDGKHYIDGISDPKNQNQVTSSFASEYPYSCGQEVYGIGGTSGTSTTFDFDYTGNEQIFDVVKTGVYSLEAWGAQGGDYDMTNLGGKGAYAYVEVKLNKGDRLYVNVGQKGFGRCTVNDASCKASYNGGAKGAMITAGGGGATHIATKSGLLTDVKGDYVLIAAGGGGGGHVSGLRSFMINAGGHCNSYCDNNNCCGTYGYHGGYKQTTESFYGNGGGYSSTTDYGHAFDYGDSYWIGVIGGTSYVTNRNVKNGRMACYSTCRVSERTTVVNDYSDVPIADYAKIENGSAKITYIGSYTM